MQALLKDLRYGARMLVKRPGFTALTVIILALGIGANTAIFSLMNRVLLRALPVGHPEQLVILSSPGPKQGRVWSDRPNGDQSFSYPMYKDLRDRNEAFSGLLARFAIPVSLAFRGQTERADGELVSGNYFEVLGARAAIGRTFTQEDDRTPGAHPVVVLSHGCWVRRFASDPGVVNQTMTVNGQVMTILGVTQAGFTGVQTGQQPDVFIPITMKAQMTPNWDGLSDHKDYWVSILGRLKPGVSRGQAEAALAPLYRGLLEAEAPLQRGRSAQALDQFKSRKLQLEDGSRGRQILQLDMRTPLLTLMWMVGLVLAVACANVASLLLARGAARQKEIAVRQSLGAGRWRLVRQLLVESVLLSLAGGVVGLLVAVWTLAGLQRWVPEGEGLSGLAVGLDYPLLAFNFSLAVLTGIAFGLVPALKATRTDLVTALKDQGVGASPGGSQARFRKGLVVAEVALTLVLLVAAGLFARSLYNLRHLDVGIRTERLITFSIAPELNGYNPTRAISLFSQLEERLTALPAVSGASGAEIALFTGSNMGSNASFEGYTPAEGEDMDVLRNNVGPGYFATMGVPLLSGREFTRQDTAQSQKVAVISESLARRFFAGRDPVGRRMAFGGGNAVKLDIEIVGVAKDSRHGSVRNEAKYFVYTPYTQNPNIGRLTFYVRTTQEPDTIAGVLRHEVSQLDPNLPVFSLLTVEEQVRQSIFGDRLMAALSAVFGLLAALLAGVGLYGVMAWTVAQRTREIGIRMALGAEARDVLKLVVGQGLILAVIGTVLGLITALALTRLLGDLLYGVSPTDPLTYAVIAVLLVAVSLAACLIPARKATRVDPIVALRYE